jgi:stage V sporulation protein B
VSSDLALAAYGTIEGMVIPIIVFPSALLNVISDLLVPELAECKSCGSKMRINYIITRIFRLGLLFSIGIMGILFYYSDELGFIIYKNNAASDFIRILAPLVPVIYLDIVVDGMLKGLGEQVSSMRYNVLDSLISVILIYFLLPKYAINGYVFTIIFTEVFNFLLSVNRLIKVTDFSITLMSIIKPIFCFISSVSIYIIIVHFTHLTFQSAVAALIINISCISIIYILLLYIFACVTFEDLNWLKSIVK